MKAHLDNHINWDFTIVNSINKHMFAILNFVEISIYIYTIVLGIKQKSEFGLNRYLKNNNYIENIDKFKHFLKQI
jgi:hypothetical protein